MHIDLMTVRQCFGGYNFTGRIVVLSPTMAASRIDSPLLVTVQLQITNERDAPPITMYIALVETSGKWSKMSTDLTIVRIVQAGVIPIDAVAVISKLQ